MRPNWEKREMVELAGNETAIAERLDFIGMDGRARAALTGLQPLIKHSIGKALEAFYDKVTATPATRKFFADDRHKAAAKGAQERHWAIVAAAEYNDDYVSGVKKIGQAHARIGLEPRWFIGGYALVMEQVINAIVRDQWPSLLRMTKSRPEGMAEAISAFVKAAMLDMDYAISVYLETLDDARRKAEEAGREALRQERALVGEFDRRGAGEAREPGSDLSVVVRNAGRLSRVASRLQRGDRDA